MRIALCLIVTIAAWGQRSAGEIRLRVLDPTGAAISNARAVLTGRATDLQRELRADASGRVVWRGLPFGPYRVDVSASGFGLVYRTLEVRSEQPVEADVTLQPAPVDTQVIVVADAPLLDAGRTGGTQSIGGDTIDSRRSSLPGRSLLDLINTQPGWLLEANGILHPRGAEYQVQYVLDGLPLFDNRSPAFAQMLSVDEYSSMEIRTANFAPEYGRKLGGVVELTSQLDTNPGLTGRVVLQGGSFGTQTAFTSLQLRQGRNTAGITAEGLATNRYLDPPVLDNYTNRGSGGSISGSYERDWSDRDRTRFYAFSRRFGFQVPNEQLQQAAGQRQDRNATETLGYVTHQHIFTPSLLANVRFHARETRQGLWANPLSTPILPWQDRGFREAYLQGSIGGRWRGHDWKAGGDAVWTSVREDFRYQIIAYRLLGVRIFDRELPERFAFSARGTGSEQAAFVQDTWRYRGLTLTGGIRFDRYRLVERATSWSPRVGVAYAIPSAGLTLRASYDRTFETPAIENLLLASTNLVDRLGGEGAFLPLEPSRGHYGEAGFTKTLGRYARLDGAWYRRRIRNFADDGLLLNTGVSFPITFARGDVSGYEAKLDVPRWGRFSGFLSYSQMVGTVTLPVAGGLFLGDEVDELLEGQGTFPMTQDQRNTVRGRVRAEVSRRVWVAAGARYNSGLPVELEGITSPDLLAAQYGPRILGQVNQERGRLLPNSTVDFSAGWHILQRERRGLQLVGDVLNVANRLNVINFSGLFSGTAIEAPRSFHIRLKADF